ncbi:M4 family metallopeptidase [Massilia sp. GCM10020059]|uniref:M4 family metallopeptidase n=1 Tax=Massilia agrisoli TaxID=2892444 RepID=A0ABS8INC9_9BURK|nr:M4 family metallopeptidase [Massilia agrisoli]MCC6070112.1 M4 family metallopeptidase [Massilia agrisoli]
MFALERVRLVAIVGFVLASAAPAAQAQLAAKTEDVVARVRAESGERIARAAQALQASRKELGVVAETDFVPLSSSVDQFGITHVRFQQRYRRLKVWGGQLVSHMDESKQLLSHTLALHRSPAVDIVPRLSPGAAIRTATSDAGIRGGFTIAPVAELLVYPITRRAVANRHRGARNIDATMMETRLVRNALAYHVHLETRNAADGDVSMEYMVDAHSGDVLAKWPSLQSAHARASGARSQYSGTVSINANSTASGFELRDMERGAPGPAGQPEGTFSNNLVLDYLADMPEAAHALRDATNTWGDGANYTTGSRDPDTLQTAGVDVAFGMQASWDFYRHVINRSGIDGLNNWATFSVVHDPQSGSGGANAAWYPSCFCMRYGDGNPESGIKNLTSLDIVAHEMAHGVNQFAGDLIYAAEPGGLNEANSDIFGAMVEFYVRGGGLAARSATIPPSGGNWNILDEAGVPNYRVMYKPSLRGGIDAWTPKLYQYGPHTASGPMNRAFYFLASGAATSGSRSTPLLPSGMTGIGNDSAFRIWYRAMNYYFTTMTDYTAARQALITASRDLFGADSAEEQAVWNAMRGINVGPAWTAAASCGLLESGRQLHGQSAISSCNGRYALAMQVDGNLVLYRHPGSALWNSGTGGHHGAYAAMQVDGNFVVQMTGMRAPDAVLWHAGTWQYPESSLEVANDGNLVVRAANGLPLWYRVAPAGAGTVAASSGANTTLDKADAMDPATSGALGRMRFGTEHYFSIPVAAGASLTLDFVGSRLLRSDNFASDSWGIAIHDASGARLADAVTDPYNTRITATYRNTGGAATFIAKVYRNAFWPGGDLDIHRYALAVRHH